MHAHAFVALCVSGVVCNPTLCQPNFHFGPSWVVENPFSTLAQTSSQFMVGDLAVGLVRLLPAVAVGAVLTECLCMRSLA